MKTSTAIVTLIGLHLGVTVSVPAAAAPLAGNRAQILERLSDCRGLADAAGRLACYDSAAASLEAAAASGAVVVLDRAQVETVRRQAFGFTLPSLASLNGDDKGDGVDAVALKIEGARRGGDGKWVFRLEGGQVWRQIDTNELMRDPKPGGAVTIRRAALGSYKLSLGGASAIRVHRDN